MKNLDKYKEMLQKIHPDLGFEQAVSVTIQELTEDPELYRYIIDGLYNSIIMQRDINRDRAVYLEAGFLELLDYYLGENKKKEINKPVIQNASKNVQTFIGENSDKINNISNGNF